MATSYYKIAEVIVGGGGTTNIDFTSIPQTYKDLFMICNLRGNASTTFSVPKLQFNADYSDSIMTNRMLRAENATANNDTTSAGLVIRRAPGGSNTANMFGSSTIWIANYASSTTHKFFEGFSTCPSDSQSTSAIGISGCVWASTSAITSIRIADDNGNGFAQYSSAFLYGIKNS
jgi:hypothetical protein